MADEEARKLRLVTIAKHAINDDIDWFYGAYTRVFNNLSQKNKDFCDKREKETAGTRF